MHKLIFLSIAFFVPCAVFLGIQTLLSAFVGGGSGDTFDPRGMGWQIAKTLFYGTIGLLFGLAIYLVFKSSGWISAYLALACTFVVQWHFATNGAIGPTEYFGFGDRIGAVQKKLKLNRSTLVKCSKDELGLVSDIKTVLQTAPYCRSIT